MRPVVKPLLAVVVALVGAACSDDGGESPASAGSASNTASGSTAAEPAGSDTTIAEPTSTVAPRASDGVLTIGVLLPLTGEGAAVGIPSNAAADSAVNLINDAGGVFGEDVRIVSEDEGDTMESAEAAIERLIAAGVDAIVGPASSLVALEYLDDLMDEGILTCSPLATSMALDAYPNRDLFFRTIASDSRSADGLATHAQRTGVTTATVVYVDDAFGRPFARRVISALRDLGLELNDEVPFRASSDLEQIASDIADGVPGTIVIVADSASGWALLSELSTVMGDDPPRIVINDAMRLPPSPEQVTALPEEFRLAIEGISPLGTPEGREEPAGAFATNSYDCVNLIALAAHVAGTDVPTEIAKHVRAVANGGAGCLTFAQCLENLERGPNIDYNGPRSRLSLAANGDPSLAQLMLFAFNESGLGIDVGQFRLPD